MVKVLFEFDELQSCVLKYFYAVKREEEVERKIELHEILLCFVNLHYHLNSLGNENYLVYCFRMLY